MGINEIQAVRNLGKKIGYGHLMQLASTLWANELEKSDLPRSGAHVPSGYPFLTEEGKKVAADTDILYQELIKEAEQNPYDY